MIAPSVPSETVRCSEPSVCSPGLECVNGWCGDPAYLKTFSEAPCQEDRDCGESSSGEMCCLLLDQPLAWRKGKAGLRRKCCNNQHGLPIKAPDRNLTEQELREVRRDGGRELGLRFDNNYSQLDQGLIYLRVYFLDLLVCDGLSYHTRRQLSGCSWYLSTTTSTTTKSPDTQSGVSTYQGMERNIAGNIKTFLLQVIYSQQYFRTHRLKFQLEITSERYFQSASVPALEWRKIVEGRKYLENFLFVVGF